MGGPSLPAGATAAASVKRSVERARLRRLVRDLLLVSPLFLFLLVVFAAPIALFMYRAVDNSLLHRSFPNTNAALAGWESPDPIPEAAFEALAADLKAVADPAALAIIARNLNNFEEGYRSLLMKTANNLPPEAPASWRDAFATIDKRWLDESRWAILKQNTGPWTSNFLLAAVDLKREASGEIVRVVPERRLYVPLLLRTFEISLTVAVICLLIGYPTAYVLTKLPSRPAGLLMICVLLPFWTSLLVRTTAWIILLQGNGPINSTLQLAGVIQQPLELIFNRFGTLVAMSHVLLPYMILPLYAVMKSIPETHMRAALSLGADQRTAFLRIYLPQTAPGIGAGLLLVFILALGYYITPALVGGPRDQMLSYMITYHVNEVVNWGMAAALALLLLAATAVLLLVLGRLVKLRQVIG
ncbi:MAG: ABC transporter permease [Rhizobiales bacterium]|nr:ABC transporter permease [Hyphomicrobiales bacterium]